MLLHPDRPFAPRKLPFFYGWWLVVVGTLGIIASIPGQTMGVSVFTDHLIEVTGMSRLALSNAYLIGTLASGLLLPRGGLLLDRLGARALAMAACAGLAATLLFLSRIDRVIGWIADALGLAASGITAAIVVTLAFGFLRFSGQGLLTMSSRAMVSKWFERRRGFVSGVIGVFINFGFSLAPVVLLAWIAMSGWRGAWLQMAAVVGVGMAGVALLFYRDNPEECGLRMDGAPAPVEGEAGGTLDWAEHSMTRSEAVRTGVFWMVTLVLAVQSMVFTGVTFHIVDIGAQAGLGRDASVALFIPIAFIGTPMGFIVGAAADRLPLRPLVAAMALFQIIGFVGVAYVGEFWLRILMIAGWGMSAGFFGPLTTVAIPKLFGRKHLGAIAGVQMSALVIGSALGPAVLAVSKRYLGSYEFGMLACCLLAAVPLVLATLARSTDAGRSSPSGE
jgi:OFA family oxalate/formate antiporter-like MFS transporter